MAKILALVMLVTSGCSMHVMPSFGTTPMNASYVCTAGTVGGVVDTAAAAAAFAAAAFASQPCADDSTESCVGDAEQQYVILAGVGLAVSALFGFVAGREGCEVAEKAARTSGTLPR